MSDVVIEAQEELVVAAAPAMEWYQDDYEGQLSVDVYQTPESIVVRSTIAGVKPEGIEITLNSDVVTIRGRRSQEVAVPKEDYFYQECYWGGFSRSIVLPMEVQATGVKATLKNGILTLVLPKAAKQSNAVAVTVAGEDEPS